MKDYKMVALFPTIIQDSNLGRELTKEEKSILTSMPMRKNVGNMTSENTHILDLPELAELKADFLEAVQNYMKTVICACPEIKTYITQSWTNYTTENQYHHMHYHKNSILSGVFYVEAVDGVDKITFYNTKDTSLYIHPTEWNAYNSTSWWYPIKTGNLIIFPSHLPHSVENKNESNIRISLAFNTFIKGNVGDSSKLTELIL